MTAVEWLTEKLWVEFGFAFSDNILEEAKEMEKQQGYSEEDMIEFGKFIFKNTLLVNIKGVEGILKQFKNK